MPHDRSSDVLGFREVLFNLRFRVAQPTNVEVVVTGSYFLPRKTSEPTFRALIFPLTPSERAIAEGLFEIREIGSGK
jgi:hypothetical protein